jgi:hypothetical protein
MNKTPASLFPESEIRQLKDVDPTSHALVPKLKRDQSVLVSPMARFKYSQPSIDARIREQLKPAISDRSTLSPEQYNALLFDTHSALQKQISNEKDEETREALRDLISLLEENVTLKSLLDQYMNHVQKA